MLALLHLILGASLTSLTGAQLSFLQPWLYYQAQPQPQPQLLLPRFTFYQSQASPASPEVPESLATPLRAAVESEPSSLVKAQTRILDLAALQAGHLARAACTEGHKPGSVCTEFFVCVHEKWSRQTCPDGLHWDNNNKNCAWPEQAGCEGGQAESEGSDESEDSGVISAPEPPKPVEAVIAEFEEWENPPPAPPTSTTAAPSSTTQDWNKPWQPPTPPPRPDYDNLPLSNGLSGEYKIVCYFTNWATYRQTGGGKFDPEDIDPKICTHIIYGFAVLDGNSLLMKSHDPYADMSDGEI